MRGYAVRAAANMIFRPPRRHEALSAAGAGTVGRRNGKTQTPQKELASVGKTKTDCPLPERNRGCNSGARKTSQTPIQWSPSMSLHSLPTILGAGKFQVFIFGDVGFAKVEATIMETAGKDNTISLSRAAKTA